MRWLRTFSRLAAGLASVHLVADTVPFTPPFTRERWVSAGAGVSVVYALVFLIPKLVGIQEGFDLFAPFGDATVYALVFVGLTCFFALEKLGRIARTRQVTVGHEDVTEDPVFWVHVSAFAGYNTVIGYALVDGVLLDDPLPFAIAMGLHLFGLDEGLRFHHAEAYHLLGRWILGGAVIVGALVAIVFSLDVTIQLWLLSVLAGGVIFNAIKEELPEDRESSFWAFLLGALVFVGVMWLLS